jgi:hypothetical protein
MKIIKFLFFCATVLVTLSSCTIITSTNVPGKNVKKFPKSLQGHYQLELGEDFAAFMGDENKMFVTFKSDRMVVNDGTTDTETLLGDSLFVSKIKKGYYLSMGAGTNYTVYKLKKEGNDVIMFPLFAQEGITANDLKPFFKSVEEIPGEVDQNGEMGASSMSVTIDDAKLEDYFKSELVMTQSFNLKFINKRKP